MSAVQSLFRKRAPQTVRDSYIALLAQARNRFFYETLGVPDSIDGRFDMIVLHLFLLQARTKNEAPEFAKFLSEVFFENMDASLREMGIGDSGVQHRIKKMGKAYHGRLQAYATDDMEMLKAALARNLYGTMEDGDPANLERMANYMSRVKTELAATPAAIITAGLYAWPAPSL